MPDVSTATRHRAAPVVVGLFSGGIGAEAAERANRRWPLGKPVRDSRACARVMPSRRRPKGWHRCWESRARRRIDFGCDAVAHHAAIAGRQHAEQSIRAPVHLQGAAKHGGVGGETLAPEAVAHHRDRAAFVVLRVEASSSRMDAEQVEEVGAGVHGPYDFAAAGALPDGVVKSGVEGEVLEDTVGAQVAVARVGDAGLDAREAIRFRR